MVICAGFPATIHDEPRQIRKEAAVIMDSGAGDKLAQIAAFLLPTIHASKIKIEILKNLAQLNQNKLQ